MTASLLPPAPRLRLGHLVDRELAWDTGFAPHLLICGDTGAGKTVAMATIVTEAQRAGALVGVCDPKGGADFSSLPVGVLTDMAEIAVALEKLTEIMRRRHEAPFSGEVVSSRVFVILDEWASVRLLVQHGDERKRHQERVEALDRSLAALVTQGRSAGIHLVLGIQRPDVSLLGSGLVRDNLRGRVALGALTDDGFAMVFPGHRALPPRQLAPGTGYAVGLSRSLSRPEPIWIDPPATMTVSGAGSTEAASPPSTSRALEVAL